jgi:ABC-2 type transport system permease protein
MNRPANQLKAAFTISKFSLLATLKSPTSIVFSLLFPIIFITVFGSMVGDKAPVMKVVISAETDTAGILYKAIAKNPSISLQKRMPAADAINALKKGQITAIINIATDSTRLPIPHYLIHLQTVQAANGSVEMLETVLNEIINHINQQVFPNNTSIATLSVYKVPGRIYRSIDFILPGQLGFSMLMAGVYGSSFLLFSLRQGLVLKRLRTTPVKRRSIILGEMLSRLFFHIISFIIMVALGYYAFQFTLVNGFATFIEMLVFSLFGLNIFLGIGFIISGVVENENSISPIANTVVLPQILLCGLFFPIESYPHWLQHFCNILPLTLFTDGLRKIAFENTHIWQMPAAVGGLIIWTLIILPLSIKAFRWE